MLGTDFKVLPTSRPLLDLRLLTAHWPRFSLWPTHFLRTHPDKDLAARLHQTDREKYSDENHKPEIAVALTTFELFVCFKPLNEIQTLLQLPFLCQFLSIAQKHFNNETLRVSAELC